MRAASELEEEREKGSFAKKLLIFAQRFNALLVSSPEVLADTVVVLQSLAALSDKVLPLKSYFNFVQDVQRTSYSEWLKAEEAKKGGESSEQKAETTPELARKLKLEEQRRLCTEDVFMVACAFLEVDIAKQGSIYYLKGESPEFRETKKNRNPLDLADGVVLKRLSSALARPHEERGEVERGQIDSGFNHLLRLYRLQDTMAKAVHWIKEGEQKNIPRRKADVRKYFALSHTEYERMMTMARREGLISFRNRKKDPANRYSLREHNHQRVVQYAEKFGHTPQKTLDKILDDYFKLLEVRSEKAKQGR